MDLSGVIFVVLAVAWAAYLIPKALKHHDEVARTRSVDKFSESMRVLASREPVSAGDARLVVAPARSSDDPRVPAPRRTASLVARKAAARAAARRRRRILGFLVVCTLVVTGLAAFAVVPWWSVAVPATLTLLYLLLCRTQVRRARDAGWEADLATAIAEEQPARVEPVAPSVPAVRNAQGFEEVAPEEETMAMPVVVDAVAVPTVDGGSLWDPLPVTLPTYVSKPKARRTVRTIDLSEPGTWSAGRSDEDSALVAQSQVEQAAGGAVSDGQEPVLEQQRAVGS